MMKFKCGECDKLYRLQDEKIPPEGITIGCKGCTNEFSISANNGLTSSSKNARVICENCNHQVDETINQCPQCNLILNNPHRDLRIDNNYYESLDEAPDEETSDESIEPPALKDTRSKVPVILAAVASSILIISSITFLSITTDYMSPVISEPIRKAFAGDPHTTEAEVVIMKTGETYYVEEIILAGDFLELLHVSGSKNKVKKQDVLSISKARIKKK